MSVEALEAVSQLDDNLIESVLPAWVFTKIEKIQM